MSHPFAKLIIYSMIRASISIFSAERKTVHPFRTPRHRMHAQPATLMLAKKQRAAFSFPHSLTAPVPGIVLMLLRPRLSKGDFSFLPAWKLRP